MDHNPPALWAKHLVKAGIDYFNERAVKTSLLVDNTVLNDPVLASMRSDNRKEFVVCVAPGYTTQLDFGDSDLTITIRFGTINHVMVVPYHAIKAVLAANTGGVLSERGQLNIISIPPVVYPPGSSYRGAPPVPEETVEVVEDLTQQPAQVELQLVARRS